MRIGHGYDVHKLENGRKLILGGVDIPYEKGLLGHSDADVLVHAVMDALLGAAGLGDIGKAFPDTDPAYEGISSLRAAGYGDGLAAAGRASGKQCGRHDPGAAPPALALYPANAGGIWRCIGYLGRADQR